jgi:hypothetical protein
MKYLLQILIAGVAMSQDHIAALTGDCASGPDNICHPITEPPGTTVPIAFFVSTADFTVPHFLYIQGGSGSAVQINLDTGGVKITGDPNEAAKAFWKSVEQYGIGIIAENKHLREQLAKLSACHPSEDAGCNKDGQCYAIPVKPR